MIENRTPCTPEPKLVLFLPVSDDEHFRPALIEVDDARH